MGALALRARDILEGRLRDNELLHGFVVQLTGETEPFFLLRPQGQPDVVLE